MAGEYSEAKKKDPNLDKYIAQRKNLTKGTPEYNAVQNKINRAYGKGPMRTETKKVESLAAPKNKPLEKPTIKAVKREVAAAPVTKRSIRETAKNRRKGARYEKQDAKKELRNTTGRVRRSTRDTDSGPQDTKKVLRRDGTIRKFKAGAAGEVKKVKSKYDREGEMTKKKIKYKKPPKAPKDKTVAQGADRADVRADRKAARANNRTKRAIKRVSRITKRMTK